MDIVFLDHIQDNVVAIDDEAGGQFELLDNGTIGYRVAGEPVAEFVSPNLISFALAVAALQRYNGHCEYRDDSVDVHQLEATLDELGCLTNSPCDFWHRVLDHLGWGVSWHP